MGALVLDTSAVAVDELHDAGIDDLPEEVRVALDRVSPDIDVSTLASYPDAALDGLANAIKGALFELRVADALASGDLQLPEGASSYELVEDFGTPGHDLELLDDNGTLVDLVQLKASTSTGIIREHLAAHPHIDDVWTTSEAAEAASVAGMTGVTDTGIDDDMLTELVRSSLNDQTSVSLGEVVDEIVPQLAFAVIAGRVALELWRGAPTSEVLSRLRSQAEGAALLSILAGVAASVSGTDAVRIPVVLTVAVARTAVTDIDVSRNQLEALRVTLSGLRA